MRVLVAEDEPLAARRLVSELNKLSDIEVLCSCGDGAEARKSIIEQKPDLVLLDVQMPKANGFEVLEGLTSDQTPLIVFTTAYKRYAIAAIKAGAIDYLLKPIDSDALRFAVNKARMRLREKDADVHTQELRSIVNQLRSEEHESSQYKTEFWAKSKNKNVRINVHELEVVEAVRDYVLMHTRSHSNLLRGKISDIEKELNPQKFVRAHRSFIVNTDFVCALKNLKGGGKMMIMQSGREVKIGRKYVSDVRVRLI